MTIRGAMLFQALAELTYQLGAHPAMYLNTPIRWLLDLDRFGRFRGWTTPMVNGTEVKSTMILAPPLLRTQNFEAKLLADNAEYALGIGHTDTPSGCAFPKTRNRLPN